MKKLRNQPGDFVDEMIDGYLAAHAHRVARSDHHARVVQRRTPKAGGVGLCIANGSGHEPIAMGFVGTGLLDANGVGDVFAAPPPDVVAATIAAADTGDGVILLISNHQGDVLNGRIGADVAREAGHRVEVLLMGDDLATAPPDRRGDRRGAPGTTFVYKVLGAAVEHGASLDESLAIGARLLAATSTLGITMAGGVSPLTGERTVSIDDASVLVGTGVHGDGGAGGQPMTTADELTDTIVDQILDDLPDAPDPEVLVLVNGAGGTTLGELLVVHRRVDERLTAHGLAPFHPLVGSLVTTQETLGFSVSVARTDAEIRRHWVAPCSAPFFPPVT